MHGRKETCYTEAAEVLRWQTGAAWQKRRRSCKTNCDKARIDLGMENADMVLLGAIYRGKPFPIYKNISVQSLQKLHNSLATLDFLHCHSHLPKEETSLTKQEAMPPEWDGEFDCFETEALLQEGTGDLERHKTMQVVRDLWRPPRPNCCSKQNTAQLSRRLPELGQAAPWE